jgi:general secretion pathway protein K
MLTAIRNTPRHRARGSALLAVLWLSAGLAAIALSVSATVRSETDRVSTSGEGLRASYLASGAVERAMLWVLWGSGDYSYSNPDGSPRFWKYGQSRLTMSFPSGEALVEVIPESAKLDINRASPEDLYRVAFAVTGHADRAHQIADGIVDWRSPSPSPSVFDQYYSTLLPTFRARHASFQEIEELLLVRGMSPELFYGNYVTGPDGRLYARGGLRDCLSVWGSLGPFDINTASPALMEAMGMPADTVASLVARRQNRPFQKPDEIADYGQLPARLRLSNGFTIFTLRATARLRRPDGSFSDVVRTAAATVKLLDRRRSQQPMQVLRWYDDAWSQGAIAPYPGMEMRGGNVPGQPGFARVGQP